MYALEKVKHDLAQKVNKFLKTSLVSAADFVTPPQPDLGDLSLPMFTIAKTLQKNPADAARDVAEYLGATAAGPYVNITLGTNIISDIVNQVKRDKKKYGLNKTGNKKRVMIEYSNANTHKEYHVGHLRNIAYGDAVNRILSANGFTVFPVSYINDFGIHVAKTIWWLKHNTDGEKIDLGHAYAQAVARLVDNQVAIQEVGGVMKEIESRRGDMYKLWKKTRAWSLDHFAKIYKELGVTFKTTFYENEFLAAGLKMVKELEKKGILKMSEGALIADLEQYNLGVLVVLRSDGTALYPVADLPLAITKIKKYKLDESLYVVDIRQSLYFHQLFKLLELLGYKTTFAHLPYDFVKLPSGMMSSRTGNVITYEELKHAALEKAKAEIIKRHTNWTTKKINLVASVVAFGALKFEMVKVGATKTITFDIEKALQFEGFTAAYVQYTFARIQSIIRKASVTIKRAAIASDLLTDLRERKLAIKIGEYPLTVEKAGELKDPAEIAKYLFELAQLTNDYYHAVPVLKAENEKLAGARLALLMAAADVIKLGLNLLGIEVVEEM